MQPLVVILEDNDEKIKSFWEQMPGMFRNRTIYIFRHQVELEVFMSRTNGPVILLLDNELGPGCGNGVSALKTILQGGCNHIQEIIITTMGLDSRKEMKACCDIYNVKYSYFNPI